MPLPLFAITAITGAAKGLIQTGVTQQRQNEIIEQNKQIALKNFQLKQTAMAKQFENYKSQASIDEFNQQLLESKAISSSRVAASDSGISGTTTGNIINNIKMQNAINKEIRNRNITQVAQNIKSQSATDFLNLQANIENLDTQKISGMDVLLGGLQGGLQGYQIGQSLQGSINSAKALKEVSILEQ